MSALTSLAATTITSSDNSNPGTGYWIGSLAFYLLSVIGLWKVFDKAKQAGWAAIVPIYNTIVLFWVIKKSGWWFLALLVPFLNIIVLAWLSHSLAKAFGKGFGYTLLLFFLPVIGYIALGFGDAKYQLK